MREFRVLEHTADVGFEAFGRTRLDVFRNAGRALMSLIVDLDSVRPRERLAIRSASPDPPGLLVNWLSDILYFQDAEGWLFRDFEIDDLSGQTLAGCASGEHFERGRHQLKLLVKAVTYHQLALEQMNDGRWRAQVYVDI